MSPAPLPATRQGRHPPAGKQLGWPFIGDTGGGLQAEPELPPARRSVWMVTVASWAEWCDQAQRVSHRGCSSVSCWLWSCLWLCWPLCWSSTTGGESSEVSAPVLPRQPLLPSNSIAKSLSSLCPGLGVCLHLLGQGQPLGAWRGCLPGPSSHRLVSEPG